MYRRQITLISLFAAWQANCLDFGDPCGTEVQGSCPPEGLCSRIDHSNGFCANLGGYTAATYYAQCDGTPFIGNAGLCGGSAKCTYRSATYSECLPSSCGAELQTGQTECYESQVGGVCKLLDGSAGNCTSQQSSAGQCFICAAPATLDATATCTVPKSIAGTCKADHTSDACAAGEICLPTGDNCILCHSTKQHTDPNTPTCPASLKPGICDSNSFSTACAPKETCKDMGGGCVACGALPVPLEDSAQQPPQHFCAPPYISGVCSGGQSPSCDSQGCTTDSSSGCITCTGSASGSRQQAPSDPPSCPPGSTVGVCTATNRDSVCHPGQICFTTASNCFMCRTITGPHQPAQDAQRDSCQPRDKLGICLTSGICTNGQTCQHTDLTAAGPCVRCTGTQAPSAGVQQPQRPPKCPVPGTTAGLCDNGTSDACMSGQSCKNDAFWEGCIICSDPPAPVRKRRARVLRAMA